jgi:hypothetical protein
LWENRLLRAEHPTARSPGTESTTGWVGVPPGLKQIPSYLRAEQESTTGWVGVPPGLKQIRSYLRAEQARHGSDRMF